MAGQDASPTTPAATRSCRPICATSSARARSQEWIDFADEHNTTIAPANTAADGARTTRSSRTGSGGRRPTQTGRRQLLFPLHVEGEELPVPTKAPEVGEHTDEVLHDVLGYDDAKVASLRDAGALG